MSFRFLTNKEKDIAITQELLNELYVSNKLDDENEESFKDLLALVKDDKLTLSEQELAFLRLHDRTVWLDYLLFRYKFRNFPKQRRVSKFPLYLLIEPVSACNLRCIMCFQVDKSFTRKPYMGLMNFELYKRIIDEAVVGGTKALTLASRGEPTLHPQLAEMLRYSADRFLELKLNTNATKLTPELCRAIVESNVNELVFSIDSYEKNEYERIRVNGKFDEVIENIKLFNMIRDEYPNAKTMTRVSGVQLNSEIDDKFISFWSELVDHVGVTPCEMRWDTYNNEQLDVDHPCDYLWERMYILWDGKVNPCDVDYKSKLMIGDVSDNSIKALWHSDAYTALRTAHIKNERKKFLPCDRCGV